MMVLPSQFFAPAPEGRPDNIRPRSAPHAWTTEAKGMFEDHPLFSLANIHQAYLRCRRRKRNTVNALRFEYNLEENLVALHEDLRTGRYRPGTSVAFLVDKPKLREIFAADFRDRVVHHILVGRLEPFWEKRFIHDSYACRKGKGTHAGVDRLRTFARQITCNGVRPAWYLQLDIRGFFITLDRNILHERITRGVRDPALLWLLGLLIFHEPTADCRLRQCRPSDFQCLPAHKTLFKSAPHCGLPIGNLTSQFFANVYLDALDQYVKHGLKARRYVRYCDDLVLLSADRAELEHWEARIDCFVRERLGLELNERRRLRPVADGIDFLGYVVRPDYVLVRRRVVGSLRERLAGMEQALRRLGMADHPGGRRVFVWPWDLIEQARQWLASYLAHLERAACHRLTAALWARFGWLNEYFRRTAGKPAPRCPRPRDVLWFGQQQAHFAACLPGHVIVLQVGRFWQALPGPLGKLFDEWERCGLLRSRFHDRDLPAARALLWRTTGPVAWVVETGRRVGRIAERVLAWRWDRTPTTIH